MESQTKHIVKPTMSTLVQNNQKEIEQTSGNTQQFLFKINRLTKFPAVFLSNLEEIHD